MISKYNAKLFLVVTVFTGLFVYIGSEMISGQNPAKDLTLKEELQNEPVRISKPETSPEPELDPETESKTPPESEPEEQPETEKSIIPSAAPPKRKKPIIRNRNLPETELPSEDTPVFSTPEIPHGTLMILLTMVSIAVIRLKMKNT